MASGISFITAMAHTPTRRIGTSPSASCTIGFLGRSCWFGGGETAESPLMKALELKVPPLALVLVFAGTMWLASAYVPSLIFALPWRHALALTFVSAGVMISLAGIVVFRQAKTTVNPIKPETTSAMVTSGVYRLSRNPMYLGFLFVLIGWAAMLSHILAFALLPLFVVYMDRFQILPEERALSAKFGQDFTKYKHSVRTWL